MLVVQLIDAGCGVYFIKHCVAVMYNGNANHVTTDQWQNMRENGNNFVQDWQFLGNIVHVPNEQFVANMTRTSTKPELATYHHQSFGSPPVSSVLRALSRHPDELLTFPGMSKKMINKHLPPATATYNEHMFRKRINQNSTRSNRQATLDARLQVDDMSPTEQICNITGDKAMFYFLVLRDIHWNTVYSDLTGRFSIQSYAGVN